MTSQRLARTRALSTCWNGAKRWHAILRCRTRWNSGAASDVVADVEVVVVVLVVVVLSVEVVDVVVDVVADVEVVVVVLVVVVL